MRERASAAWEKLKSQDPGMDSQTIMRSTVALIALAGFLLPWIRLDGHNDPMTGSEIIAYAFTSPERATIFSTSLPSSMALLMIPPVTAIAVLYGMVRLIQGGHSLGSHLLGAALPLVMVLSTGAIASSDGFRIGGIPLPGIGIIATVITQGILFLDALVEGRE